MAANKDTEDDEFSAAQFRFKAEVINAFAKEVRLTLNDPKSLMCMMRVGASRQVTVAGQEDFFLTAAIVLDNPEVGPREMRLRIEPTKRQEYRFADVPLKGMKGFSGTLGHKRYDSWEAIYEAMLNLPCRERPGYTYRALIDAAEAAEKGRILKQSIEAHNDFGSW